MCGCFSVSLPPDEIGRYFKVSGPLPNFPPRYNLAPTQLAPVVRFNPETRTRQLDLLRWGLIPSWATDTRIGNQCINARGDDGAQACIPTGLREGTPLHRTGERILRVEEDRSAKQPMFIPLTSGEPMGMASPWGNWREPDGNWLRTFTIVTGEPNELVASIHNRMPVILRPESLGFRLGEAPADDEALRAAYDPYPADKMRAYPISTRVNSPRNDDPEILRELA